MEINNTPKLKPPGHPLPVFQRLLLRYLGSRRIKAVTPQKSHAVILHHYTDIKIIISENSDLLTTPKLVSPRMGLEDSSRYWSVVMTLEHLGIVNTLVWHLLEQMAKGETHFTEAKTALVKPKGLKNTEDTIQFFEASTKKFIENGQTLISQIPLQITHRHPWFGLLPASGWFAVIGVHLGLHKRQILEIIAQNS